MTLSLSTRALITADEDDASLRYELIPIFSTGRRNIWNPSLRHFALILRHIIFLPVEIRHTCLTKDTLSVTSLELAEAQVCLTEARVPNFNEEEGYIMTLKLSKMTYWRIFNRFSPLVHQWGIDSHKSVTTVKCGLRDLLCFNLPNGINYNLYCPHINPLNKTSLVRSFRTWFLCPVFWPTQ